MISKIVLPLYREGFFKLTWRLLWLSRDPEILSVALPEAWKCCENNSLAVLGWKQEVDLPPPSFNGSWKLPEGCEVTGSSDPPECHSDLQVSWKTSPCPVAERSFLGPLKGEPPFSCSLFPDLLVGYNLSAWEPLLWLEHGHHPRALFLAPAHSQCLAWPVKWKLLGGYGVDLFSVSFKWGRKEVSNSGNLQMSTQK